MPIAPINERRLLQIMVVVLGLIPVGAGLAGCVFGLQVFDAGARLNHDVDSHGRYLSGLLLGIGLGFWSCVADIERNGPRVRLLTLIVFIGGLARLAAAVRTGWPGAGMSGGLAMELLVTPGLALWRERIERL